MFKKIFIPGLLLLLIGGVTFAWLSAGQKRQREQIASYKLKYTSQLDGYLRKYDEWLQLPSQEREEFGADFDEAGKGRTNAQLRVEQKQRLKADMDRLATGQTSVYPFAHILYGENWQEELRKYKARKELEESILAASILFISAGGILSGWSLLVWTARLLIKTSKKLFALYSSRKQKERDEQSVETDIEQEQSSDEHQTRSEKLMEVLADSGWRNFDNNIPVHQDSEAPQSGDSLETRTEELEKQIAGFETVVQKNEQVSDKSSEVLSNTLKALAEEVGAIRSYACQQQDRVKKLQEGYDWNIFRNFGLRVIRCIDNLEIRISRLSKQNADTEDIVEIRDELIFALESSGLEKFEPELNSSYSGQEKIAEAVKDKEAADDSKLSGTIAKVIRSGYRYAIDEENFRIVRPAQVKLFGRNK